jgi:uncharacterized protein YbjT (DUF2867 family)
MKIVIVGGTGLIGAKVVENLRKQGHEVVVASRSAGIDAFTGKGLTEALKGAQVVVDTSNSPSWEANAVMQFFQTSTRNLLEAEVAAGVRHHVALSVVGADRMPGNTYMPAKVAQESIIAAGPIPYTIVRATQFFEFVGAVADSGTVDGTVRLPAIQFQPIAGDDVASIVARIAVAAPLNSTIEIAGPERKPLEQFVERLFASKGDKRPVATRRPFISQPQLMTDPSFPGINLNLEISVLKIGSLTTPLRPRILSPNEFCGRSEILVFMDSRG